MKHVTHQGIKFLRLNQVRIQFTNKDARPHRLFLSYLKGRGNLLSEAMVFACAGNKDEGINFFSISFSIDEAPLSHKGFHDFTNNESMTSQVKVVKCFTLKVYRAFLNKGRGFQFAVENGEDL